MSEILDSKSECKNKHFASQKSHSSLRKEITSLMTQKILEMKTIKDIMGCMSKKRYNITTHARREMSPKEDDISEKELVEAILDGGIIEDYPNDKPFPSCLIFGRTEKGRPIHAVCAYSKENDIGHSLKIQ